MIELAAWSQSGRAVGTAVHERRMGCCRKFQNRSNGVRNKRLCRKMAPLHLPKVGNNSFPTLGKESLMKETPKLLYSPLSCQDRYFIGLDNAHGSFGLDNAHGSLVGSKKHVWYVAVCRSRILQ